MNRTICLIITSLIITNLLGCKNFSSSYVYLPPNKAKYDNEVFIDRPFSVVWDELIEQLSKSIFVISNFEKASSGIIDLLFSTDTPGKYVDCGRTTWTHKNRSDKEVRIYKTAESSTYKNAHGGGTFRPSPIIESVIRETSLEGRINIFVAPEGDGTRITVNCRYTFKVNISGDYERQNVYGEAKERGSLPSSSSEIIFLNTIQVKRNNWETSGEPENAKCYSTGKLEQEILNLIKQ